jgi:hypothetical protein
MSIKQLCAGLALAVVLVPGARADLFGKLDQALPSKISITANYPVFDFDTDGCLPSAGISREGKQNGGLNPSGSITGGCRAANFLDYSNSLHRYACIKSGNDTYCGHFYALYFLKDQISALGGGHRHDWEYVAIWTKNGAVTHGGYSAHGDLNNADVSTLALQNGHLKFVYHKDGALTHAMRFASSGEAAENGYGTFVTPLITSWYELKGDGVSNATLRANLNSFDYGSATIPLRDSNFLSNLNTYKPSGYPSFTQASIEASQP